MIFVRQSPESIGTVLKLKESPANVPAGSELRPIFLRLPPAHIVNLRGVIESYEGIAEIRTLDREVGEVVLLALEDTASLVREILREIGPDLQLREIPRPPSTAFDWLMREELSEEDN